jgi:integrase
MRRRANGEGSVFQRKDGRWEATMSLPGAGRKSYFGKTKQEALGKMRAGQRNVQDGLPVPPERLILKAYLEKWLEDSVKPTVRPYTLKSYSSLVHRHISPELGQMHLNRLSAQDVQGFLNRKLATGLSPRSVQYIHAVLRRALGQAERWGIVARNVARFASPPHVPQANIQPLTPVESKKLLAAVKGDRLEALYTVALAVGLRQGEALGLRWANIHLEAGTLSVTHTLQKVDGVNVLVQPKTERSRRTIKLPEICLQALRTHRGRQILERVGVGEAWQEWGLVFCEPDGTPLSRYSVTRRFQAILANAGIPKHRFHDLRHTCATLLLVQGVPLRVVMEILGHSQMATTADIYSHVLPVLMADAAAKMDLALVGA